jgi:hypothetical protein
MRHVAAIGALSATMLAPAAAVAPAEASSGPLEIYTPTEMRTVENPSGCVELPTGATGVWNGTTAQVVVTAGPGCRGAVLDDAGPEGYITVEAARASLLVG